MMESISINPMPQRPTAIQRDLDRLRETAGQIVGRVFYGTLLKGMRESSMNGTFGHGGRGEEVFASQFHAILAERMGRSSGSALTDTIYRAYERQQRALAAATGAGGAIHSD